MGGAQMKHSLLILIILAASWNIAQVPASDTHLNWSSGTACILPVNRWETGVFLPLRWGCSPSLELSIHPLAVFVIPNVSAKWSHGTHNGWMIASRHSMYYPTPLLRMLAKKGTGGIISPQFEIPHMVSISNEVLVSHPIKKFLATGKLGLAFALKSAALDENSTIDVPVVFPRLNVFYNDIGLRTGINVEGKIYKRWRISVDTDLFYYPGGDEKMAFEQKSLLFWQKSGNFQLCLGYMLSWAQYPFGNQCHLLGPLLDLEWGWNK
jgi:hypothetical protein